MLILAAEDYTGKSPDYADTSGPNYLSYYQQALQAMASATTSGTSTRVAARRRTRSAC